MSNFLQQGTILCRFIKIIIIVITTTIIIICACSHALLMAYHFTILFRQAYFPSSITIPVLHA